MRLFMRIRSRAAPGLAEARARADHHRVRAASAEGAMFEMSLSAPHTLLDPGCFRRTVGPGRRPGIVVVGVDPLGVRPVEDEGGGPVRIGGGEEDRHGAALGVAEQGGSLAADRIHHGADIVHPGLQVGQATGPVGQARAPLVEPDQPGERAEPVEEVGRSRLLPVDLEVGDEPGHQHEVDGTAAGHLIGDVDPGAPGVADLDVGHPLRQVPGLVGAGCRVAFPGRGRAPPSSCSSGARWAGGRP